MPNKISDDAISWLIAIVCSILPSKEIYVVVFFLWLHAERLGKTRRKDLQRRNAVWDKTSNEIQLWVVVDTLWNV